MSDTNTTNTTNTTNNVKTEVKHEVKQDVQSYTNLRPHLRPPLRPPNIKIENSRWDLDSNDNTTAGDMTALPKFESLHIPIPELKRSVQHVISNNTDSDIESEL